MRATGKGGPEVVGRVWELMSEFVRSFDSTEELRSTLALGRGSGRVKTLLGLADEPLSVAELARSVGVDPPYATIIVNELQALGLVSRSGDERDRRRKLVTLTDQGRAAASKAQEIIARPPAPLNALDPADLESLFRILSLLTGEPEDRPGR
jgi:DNA-binding MarR family transcriptional regulator